MQIFAVTIFPPMFDAITNFGITRRAVEAGLLIFNP